MKSILSSKEAFDAGFRAGLRNLLDGYHELGVYILVLANARFDENTWRTFSGPLQSRFELLSSEMRRHRRWFGLDDAEDDLEVFRRIMEVGFAGIEATEFRSVGPWELQFNQLRGFRPPRMTRAEINGIRAPFDYRRFNFNKPFLRKEIFWQGKLLGRNTALFYNKFPFVQLHTLLVPEPKRELPQFLTIADHEYIWQLVTNLCRTLPRVGFGYNSYGAYASVNHLHFQMFQCEQPLPITLPDWKHNGGALSYPVKSYRFESLPESWEFIDTLHREHRSYNLIYLPGVLYCIPRRRQGSYIQSNWTEGFAWHEMAGAFITSRKNDFLILSPEDLGAELARVRVI